LNPVDSSHKRKHFVIVGNGGAGISAAKAACSAGYQGIIHMVSDIEGPTFNPMLSPYYLSGEIVYERCFPFGKEFYEKNSIQCHFGSPVEAIDTQQQKVYVSGGGMIPYDDCLIATGASPLLPKVPGIQNSYNVFTLRTAEQMIRLKKALMGAKNAVILGASLIGIKLAEVLMRKGIRVILVELTKQVLPFFAHPQLAPIIHEHLLNKGVDLRLSWALEGLEEKKGRVYLHFQEDQIVKTDLVLICIGIKPNLEFLKGTQIEVDRGIIVDDHMQTNINHVYAAGDVSQGTNQLTGKKEMMGLWGNACYQGRTAGYNVAGMNVSYPGYLPQYVNHFFGITFIHLGDINPQGGEIEILKQFEPSEGIYSLLVFDKGVLVGANLINNLKEAGRLKTAILRKQTKEGGLSRYFFYPSGKDFNLIKPVFSPSFMLAKKDSFYN